MKLLSIIFLMENRFFFHTIHPDHSSPSLPPSTPPRSPPPPTLSCTFTCCSFPFRKEQAAKRQEPNTTKQDTLKQDKISHIRAGHGNPIGAKGLLMVGAGASLTLVFKIPSLENF